MTENEIREEIKELKRKADIFENRGYATAGISLSFKKSVKVIEELLEELQQYRAIGTPEGYERAIQSSIENYNLYREYKAKVQEFEAIGTIEEFKTLKECVYVDERPFIFVCPNCKEVYTLEQDERPIFCRRCNEKIDWNKVIFYKL